MNGIMSERGSKKKRRSAYSSDEEETGSYNSYISEERYRAMLGDHIQKYKRRLNYASQSPAPTRTGTMTMKSNVGLKDHKLMNDNRGGFHKFESTSDFLNSSSSQKLGNYPESDFGLQYGASRFVSHTLCIPCHAIALNINVNLSHSVWKSCGFNFHHTPDHQIF